MSAWLSGFVGDLRVYWPLFVLGFLPNEVWRFLGWWVGARIDEGTEIFIWVRLVATSIMAAVIGQLLVVPPGLLANVPALVRYGAVAAGLFVFLAVRRSMLLAVIVGELVLIVGRYWTLPPG
jgi:hypothetical protein